MGHPVVQFKDCKSFTPETLHTKNTLQTNTLTYHIQRVVGTE